MRKQGKKRVDWLKAISLTVVGIIVLGFTGLGVWKTVDLIKDAQNKVEASDQDTLGHGSEAVSLEEKLATKMVA